MPSVLCISSDPSLSDELEKLALQATMRFRVVTSIEMASEWISMQKYDVLLIDPDDLQLQSIIDTFALAWKHNPGLYGGVVCPNQSFDHPLDLKLLGAELYDGTNALDKLGMFFKALPTTVAFGESSYYGVLVVEDLDSPRDIICAYIESLGYSVVKGISNAHDALEELSINPYEYFVVVSDLQMPKMNGVALIEAIRANDLISGLPVIMLTSAPSTENLIDCLKAGATGFLAKPPKKRLLQKELERAKRIIHAKQNPRLCEPEDAEKVEEEIRRIRLLA